MTFHSQRVFTNVRALPIASTSILELQVLNVQIDVTCEIFSEIPRKEEQQIPLALPRFERGVLGVLTRAA